MDKIRTVFFRNDDVGLFSSEPVSSELVNLTQTFIEENIPISHGVVPEAVNEETVKWLLEVKSKYPHLIGIEQHGFSHTKHEKGEFGGRRGYEEQKGDIMAGMEFMKHNFGVRFSWCFTSPWVKYNSHTKRICDELGFKVFSGGVSPKVQARVFNAIGRLFNLNVLGPKEVSYHRTRRFDQKGFRIAEISPSIDVIKDYRERTLKKLDAIRMRYDNCRKHFDVIGFLLHQWVFDTRDKIQIIRELLIELKKDEELTFHLLENIQSRRR